MKKIMLVAAIVCAVAMSHAGAIIWGLNTYENHGPTAAYDSTDWEGYLNCSLATTAYLYLGDTLIDQVNYDADDWTYGKFNTGAPTTSSYVNAIASSTDEGSLQNFRFVLKTNDGKYEAELAAKAEIVTVTGAGSDTYMQGFIFNDGLKASDWKAVPEPTSGLLLLLGMAGLALRRRRA